MPVLVCLLMPVLVCLLVCRNWLFDGDSHLPSEVVDGCPGLRSSEVVDGCPGLRSIPV